MDGGPGESGVSEKRWWELAVARHAPAGMSASSSGLARGGTSKNMGFCELLQDRGLSKVFAKSEDNSEKSFYARAWRGGHGGVV